MALQALTQEPIIVDGALFLLRRELHSVGSVSVHVGDRVEPDTTIATASAPSGRVVTIHLARELGVAPDGLGRYLTKPVGSSFQAGEAIARTRRGLRVVAANAPVAGTLSEINESTGTATLVPATESYELRSLVSGEVESIIDDRGAVIRTSGARVRGVLALGEEVSGPLKVAIDRPDRELTPDSVTGEVRNAVVLGGMTIGAAAIRRLAELGAKAVVVGSVSEAEIRRAVRPGEELSASLFWQAGGGRVLQIPEGDRLPIAVFVTEGFGRRPMAAPIFEFLAAREGQVASLLVPDLTRAQDAHPELYFTSATGTGDDTIRRASPASGVVARLVDPAHLGTVVTCCSEPTIDRANGEVREVVEVEWTNGSRRFVPVANLEILKVPA